jgi:ABC-type branched-subunit amino acid transport system ATPase component
MKVLKARIRNFRSLRDVYIDQIGNMTILLGKNSSGKSNLLEALALFFNEFNLIEAGPAAGSASGLDHYLWFDGDTSKPVEITLTIELDDEECEELFPAEALDVIKQRYPETYNQLTISRRIVDLKTGRRTEYVKWAEVPLVKDNRLVSPDDFAKSITPTTASETATSQPAESAAAKMLGRIAPGIQEMIRGRFLLARVTRDASEKTASLVTRVPLIDSETRDTLVALGQSRARRDVKRWAWFERIFENFSSMRLDVRESEIFTRRDDIYLPICLAGGGDQEVLAISSYLLERAPILGIEEPEMHLHPGLVKRVFELLREHSTTTQLFVATHSPTILDLADLDDVLLVRMEAEQTKVYRLSAGEGLCNLIWELEVKPSDVLFAERVLLVESEAEKATVLTWARKLNLSFDDVTIVPIGARAVGRYRLRTWLDIMQQARIPTFLLLTKGSRDEVATLVDEGVIPQRNCVTLPGDVEDLYPIPAVVKALSEECGLSLSNKDIDARKPRKNEIERVLNLKKKLRPGWRVAIALRVAEMMSKEEIPAEIKILFENVLRRTEH